MSKADGVLKDEEEQYAEQYCVTLSTPQKGIYIVLILGEVEKGECELILDDLLLWYDNELTFIILD